MDYSKILSKSWQIIRKYRSLWLIGILAGFAETASVSSGNSFPGGSSNTTNTPAIDTGSITEGLPKVLGAATKTSDDWSKVIDWASQNVWLCIGLVIIAIIICLIMLYIGSIAKAGLILSISEEEKGTAPGGFRKIFASGNRFAGRLFGQTWLITLMAIVFIFVAIIIVLIPTWLFHTSVLGVTLTVLLGLIAIISIMAAALFISPFKRLSDRALVLEDLSITESLSRGFFLLKTKLGNSLIVWLIEIGISIAIGIGIIIAAVGVIMVLGLLGVALYFANHIILVIYVGIVGLALFAALILLGGIITAYFSTYWTISYIAISHLAKTKAIK
jgi:hypothetical protein